MCAFCNQCLLASLSWALLNQFNPSATSRPDLMHIGPLLRFIISPLIMTVKGSCTAQLYTTLFHRAVTSDKSTGFPSLCACNPLHTERLLTLPCDHRPPWGSSTTCQETTTGQFQPSEQPSRCGPRTTPCGTSWEPRWLTPARVGKPSLPIRKPWT